MKLPEGNALPFVIPFSDATITVRQKMKSLLQCRRSGRFAPLGRIFSGGLRAMIVPEGEHCTEKQWSKRNISTSNSTFFHNHEMSGDLRRFLEEVR